MTVTARDPRQDAVDALDTAWEIGLADTKNTGNEPTPAERISRQLAIAQVSALIYIGDAVNALREENRWRTDQDLQQPGMNGTAR